MGRTVLIGLLVVLGPFLLLSGVADRLRRHRFDTVALRATGTVTSCERRPGLETDGPVYLLRVRFTAPTGEGVEFGEDSARAYDPGAPIEVRHAPRPPWTARVPGASSGSTLRAYGLVVAGAIGTLALAGVLSGVLPS